MYTNMDLWVQVRRYVLAEGHSKRSACRVFGLNWRTMRKMLEHPEPPGYRRQATPQTRKIDRVLPILHQWLEEDRTAPGKQWHTARRIYERLRDEHGFDGQETIVKPPESRCVLDARFTLRLTSRCRTRRVKRRWTSARRRSISTGC